VLINNILCATFNFYISGYTATPPASFSVPNGYYTAVFFDKKWFMVQQGTGTIDYVAGAPVGGVLGEYGAAGNQLFRLFGGGTNAVNSVVQTALWAMADPIRDKQTTKVGVEAILPSGGAIINLTMDNPVNTSLTPYILTDLVGWQNNAFAMIGWKNNTSSVITWSGGFGGYQLYRADAQQPGGGVSGQKYTGLTLTSNTANLVYSTFELEYEKRARF
jgi:hypothetical protein